MSVNPISWPQIDAWAARRKLDPQQWELDAITSIDSAQISSILEDQEKPKK
jgi:hypothetical protein